MNRFFLWGITAVNLSVISFVLYLYFTKEKIAYVNLNKVYKEFEMKKELENKLISIQQNRKTIIDSLEIQLRAFSRHFEKAVKIDEKEQLMFDQKKEEYRSKKKNFTEDNQALTQQYTDQIMKQLNEYVRNYGKDHNYDFLLGADNNGSIMHAKEQFDVSDDVIKYINKAYKGVIK